MKKDHVKAKRFLLYTSILYIIFYKMVVFFYRRNIHEFFSCEITHRHMKKINLAMID